MTTDEIVAALAPYRFTSYTERSLQDVIARALETAGIDFRREKPLSVEDRPDFLCEGVAVEIKIKGSLADVTRQLHRYAQHPSVTSLLLVTTKAAHTRIAREMNGKPVHVHFIVGGAF
jgi:hypothetical protein